MTDVTNASRTGLMDLATLSWHEPALRYFGVPAGALPRIRSNAEVYGRVASGPFAGVPIAGACPPVAHALPVTCRHLRCVLCSSTQLRACRATLLPQRGHHSG